MPQKPFPCFIYSLGILVLHNLSLISEYSCYFKILSRQLLFLCFKHLGYLQFLGAGRGLFLGKAPTGSWDHPCEHMGQGTPFSHHSCYTCTQLTPWRCYWKRETRQKQIFISLQWQKDCWYWVLKFWIPMIKTNTNS